MKVTLERTHLLRSLTHVHRVVERRNTIPILSNVLLKAEGGTLMLKATDLDLEIVEHVPAMVATPGATTVPAHVFYEIVRKLSDGAEVSLATTEDGMTLELISGRSRFQLQMLPESDFPDITAGEFSHKYSAKAESFKRLIDRTQFAISTEETRYYLNGIYLHTIDEGAGEMLRAVATDGHRLALAEMAAPSGASGMPGIIVPRKAVSEIQKLLDDPEAEIAIEVSESKIRLSVNGVLLTSKLIDGTFPDYQRVIPKGNDIVLEADKDSFAEAVDRVSTISSERGRAVKMIIEQDKLELIVSNPDSGTASEELMVACETDRLEIGFNARYLLDIASQLQSENAVFRLADSNAPTLIEDKNGEATLYVLMPMRV